MSMYDTTLSQIYAKDMGAMQKENKRCIPKEGMPHAQACQKKKERQPLIQKERKRDSTYKGVHTPSTKNIHTLAHLDQGL